MKENPNKHQSHKGRHSHYVYAINKSYYWKMFIMFRALFLPVNTMSGKTIEEPIEFEPRTPYQ